MDINHIQSINKKRAQRWHNGGLSEWSPLEWAGAMAGEAGEACNAAKKLKRVDGQLRNLDKRGLTSPVVEEQRADYQLKIAEECADAIIYAILLMSAVGHDAEDTIRKVFNQKSIEYDFPERL